MSTNAFCYLSLFILEFNIGCIIRFVDHGWEKRYDYPNNTNVQLTVVTTSYYQNICGLYTFVSVGLRKAIRPHKL